MSIDNVETSDPGVVEYAPSSRSFSVRDFGRSVTGDVYWRLPVQFIGNKVPSHYYYYLHVYFNDCKVIGDRLKHINTVLLIHVKKYLPIFLF